MSELEVDEVEGLAAAQHQDSGEEHAGQAGLGRHPAEVRPSVFVHHGADQVGASQFGPEALNPPPPCPQ